MQGDPACVGLSQTSTKSPISWAHGEGWSPCRGLRAGLAAPTIWPVSLQLWEMLSSRSLLGGPHTWLLWLEKSRGTGSSERRPRGLALLCLCPVQGLQTVSFAGLGGALGCPSAFCPQPPVAYSLLTCCSLGAGGQACVLIRLTAEGHSEVTCWATT